MTDTDTGQSTSDINNYMVIIEYQSECMCESKDNTTITMTSERVRVP